MPYQITPSTNSSEAVTGEFSAGVPAIHRPAQRTPIIFVKSASGACCKADSRSCLTLKGYNPRNWIETEIGRWDTNGNETDCVRRFPEQGNVDAQLNLGDIYARGDGVPENLAEVVQWLRRAAEQGHADAQFSLAVIRHR